MNIKPCASCSTTIPPSRYEQQESVGVALNGKGEDMLKKIGVALLLLLYVIVLSGCGGGSSTEQNVEDPPLTWDEGNWDQTIWR